MPYFEIPVLCSLLNTIVTGGLGIVTPRVFRVTTTGTEISPDPRYTRFQRFQSPVSNILFDIPTRPPFWAGDAPTLHNHRENSGFTSAQHNYTEAIWRVAHTLLLRSSIIRHTYKQHQQRQLYELIMKMTYRGGA